MKIVEIEEYINTLIEDELRFKNPSSSSVFGAKQDNKGDIWIARLLRFVWIFSYSIWNLTELYLKIVFHGDSIKDRKIVYTAKNFCNTVDGKLVDRVLKPLFTDNIIFINQSKDALLTRINDQKVYNLGGVVKFLSYFYGNKPGPMCFFRAYTVVNNLILRNLKQCDVYMLWFYDMNSLSLIFSRFRANITLIEVQHGSIINYPPYVKPSPVKTADIFYVKNEPTIEYLKSHLCLDHPAEYRLIPYPQGKRKYIPGVHILYASTVEFNGLHPRMKEFLADFDKPGLDLIVRLHPREKEKEPLFTEQLEQYGVRYRFDRSENWLDGNTIENLIVVSPWSSTIEDSYDNGFPTIVIDPVGMERYRHLIDNKRCFYSDQLALTIKQLTAS